MTIASGPVTTSRSKWIPDGLSDVWRVLKQRKPALAGLAFLGLLIFISIFADWIAPFKPDDYTDAVASPPSWQHWFGVDHLGRDIFSRVVYGARISLWVGLLAVGISLSIGTTLGLIAGYFGGIVDTLIMRAMDIMMALPYVLLAILIATILGPSLENGILAIGIVRVPRFARLARASTLSVRTLTYVEASRAIGAPHHRIIFRDILPNILGPIVVYSTLSLGDAILSAAVLSFLGLGAQPPVPEWGAMLNEAQKYLINAPFMSIFPGLAIFLTVLAFNLLGDGLRDILDPRVRR
jgi:ABC-type dipeptide/oligopeptide/nickel transport system permease subunit